MSGSVLPNAGQIDAKWADDMPDGTTVELDKLIKNAMFFGGACTKKFMQADPRKKLAQGFLVPIQSKGIPGVCWALSMAWIQCHAMEKDFWGWLYNRSTIERDTDYVLLGKKHAYDILDIQLAINLRNDAAVIDGRWMGGYDRMELYTETRMSSYGLIRNSFGTFDWSRARMLAIAMGERIAPDLSAGSSYAGGCYKAVHFRGEAGGHACGAWAGQDVSYFDPNYGEFWFPTAAAFRSWFIRYWLDAFYYRKKYGWEYRVAAYSPRYQR